MKKLFFSIFFIFTFTSAFAQVPWVKKSYFQNWGGLNDNLSSTEIQDNEATDLQNIVFDTGGAIKKRYGYITVPNNPVKSVATGTAIQAITGLSFYKKDSGSKYLVAIANVNGKATAMKKDYEVGGGPESGSWDNIDASALPSSYLDTYQSDFAVAQDVLVFTTGINTAKPYKWAGTGNCSLLAGDPNLPNATIVEYHKNQLFLAGNDTYPSRVYFSNLDNIYSYTITDFFDVETSDGSKVTALLSVYDSLYIFKDKSIWRLSGTNRDDFTLQKLVDGIGTLSNASVKVVNNVIYFTTSQNDIAAYDGGVNVVFLSQKIRNTIGGLNFSRATNTLGLAFSTYKYIDNDYYCAVSNVGSSINNKMLLFDTAFKAWSKFDGINANAWCVGENNLGQNLLFFGDYNGYVHYYPSTSYYDGNVATSPTVGLSEVTSPIISFYQTKWFRYSDLCLGDKYWRRLKSYVLSETSGHYLYAEVRSDYEASGKVVTINLAEGSSLWDVAIWDEDLWGGQSIVVNTAEIEKGKSMFQVKYYNNNVNEGYTLIGFENFIEPTDRI